MVAIFGVEHHAPKIPALGSAGPRENIVRGIRQGERTMAHTEEYKFKEMFRIFDKRTIGYISCELFQDILAPMKNEVGLKDEEVKDLIYDEIDKDKNQKITFNEFFKFMSQEDEEEEPVEVKS